ncbi:MAG TPA: 3-deoxy-manno-octulosonate cytidylyltransferase [Chthonomonadales bacterium]|nr:3-deoxy-manno-octulosonate cytidylyltransferase [Chthonomonadales bacterium]
MTDSRVPVGVTCIIPARLASTRLPNKPLVDLCGKTMLQRVWERASAAQSAARVVIATPDREVAQAAERFGAQAVMTSPSHRSGSDRIAEAADLLRLTPDEIVVNVQGDEPLLDPASIDMAVEPLTQESDLFMTSLMCACPATDLDNPSTVKVVCNIQGDALYFSRARIPFSRAAEAAEVMQHIGLYAYRRSFLRVFTGLAPAVLEQVEVLEQLRALEHGYRIRMVTVRQAPIGVDTAEDLQRARELLQSTAPFS